MGTTYTSTIEVRCVKEHTCLCCGGQYAYELKRKVKGSAGNKETAGIKARRAAARAMERDVDMEPCPTCGMHQPDMIAQRRAKRHKTVFWVALIGFVAIVILRVSYLLPYDTAVWLAVAACAAATGAHLIIDFANPNRDLDANRNLATQRVASGAVKHQAGQYLAGSEHLAQPPRTLLHRLTLVILLGGVVLAGEPEAMRLVRGWPLNHECYPPVIGPSDETRIYMTEKIESIKGFWRGQPRVILHEPGGMGEITARAQTNQNDWGSTINAKSSEKRSTSTPWVSLTLPNDPALSGKKLTCEITLNIAYPEIQGDETFLERASSMQRTIDLQLASTVGAGGSYNGSWWTGSVLAMALILFCGRCLIWAAGGLERKAKPTRVFVQQ